MNGTDGTDARVCDHTMRTNTKRVRVHALAREGERKKERERDREGEREIYGYMNST